VQGDSQAALSWLESLGVDLSGRVQLGGHSRKRTHTSSRGPVGFAIMKALLDREAADGRIRVVTGAKVRGGLWGMLGALLHGMAEHGTAWRSTSCSPPAAAPPPRGCAQASALLHSGSRVAGVAYTDADGSEQRLEASAVVLATGGFGASTPLLQQYAPQVRWGREGRARAVCAS
jgi:aspartate oxidase